MKGRLPRVVILLDSYDPSFGHLWSGNYIATSTATTICFRSRKVIGPHAPANLGSDRGHA